MSELDDHIAGLPPLGADDAAYLVFGDWLQSRGDRWGELIALHNAGKDGAAQTLLRERGSEILGLLQFTAHELVWHMGFVRRATLQTPADKQAVLDVTKALLALPCARKLETLVLAPQRDIFHTTNTWGESGSNIVDPWPDWDDFGPLVHERITDLRFGAWPAEPAAAYIEMPSFDMISRWLRTTLRHRSLTGSWRERAEAFDLPALVELELHFADATKDALGRIGVSNLPALERLTIGLGGDAGCLLDDLYPPGDDNEYPPEFTADDLAGMTVNRVRDANIPADVMRRFLDDLPPTVTDLSFTSSVLTTDLLTTIVVHPRLARLRRLDLSACTLSDAAATVLIETPGVARVPSLDISRNAFTAPVRSQLARALPNATIGDTEQRRPDFFMRYVATME